MNDLQKSIMKMREIAKTKDKKIKHDCELCNDTGWIVEGYGPEAKYKECQCSIEKRLTQRWLKFGVDPGKVKKISDFKAGSPETRKIKALIIDYIKNFDKYSSGSVIFCGGPGVGKTHLALGTGAALINRGVNVIYMPYVEAMRELKSLSMEKEEYIRATERYYNTSVLIIDDLFKVRNKKIEAISDADIKHLYPLINHRYNNNLPIICSTEFYIKELQEIDRAIAGRIVEMAGSNTFEFPKETQDNRLKGLY